MSIEQNEELTTEATIEPETSGETVDTTQVEEGSETDATSQEAKADETSATSKTEPEADEVVVTIGDETPAPEDEEIAKAPEWVRELRKSNRELTRKVKEQERQLAEKSKPAEVATLGPKPKMSDANIDYDADKYEAELDKWNKRKQEIDNANAQRQAEENKAQEAWQGELNRYATAKTQLKVKDYAEFEAVVSDALNVTQQGIVVKGADNAALVIYALGKNPSKLKELSAITDPVKFAFAVAKLEKELKVTNRKSPPPPEKTVTGSAPKSGVVDSTLEKLRAEAEKTGNYSKVIQYQNQKRKAS